MHNELKISTKSSDNSNFEDYTNKQELTMIFNSDSSLAVSKTIAPLKKSVIVNFTECVAEAGTINIESLGDNRYKILSSDCNFNPNVNVNITNSSIFTITSSGGIGVIECADFNLSLVDVGDKLIFHSGAPNGITPQEVVFTITGKDNKKIYVKDVYGLSSFNGSIVSIDNFSVFKPVLLDSFVVRLNGDLQQSNHGLYAIDSATDKYLVIKSEKTLIEGETTITQRSLSVFTKIINFATIKTLQDCVVEIDGKELEIKSFGNAVFTATLQASTISIRNVGQTELEVMVIFGTSSLDVADFTC